MKISDLFKNQNLDNQRRIDLRKQSNAQPKVDIAEDNSQAGGVAGVDKISVSPLSRQLLQISNILSDEEIARSKRIDELKERVSSGEYQVSSEDVAKAVIDFARSDISS